MAQGLINQHVTLRLTRVTPWGSQPHPLPGVGGSEATSAPLWAGLITRDELDPWVQPSLGFSVSPKLSTGNVPAAITPQGLGEAGGIVPGGSLKQPKDLGGGTPSSLPGRK